MTDNYETITPAQFEVKTFIPSIEENSLRYYVVDQDELDELLTRVHSDQIRERVLDISPLDDSQRPTVERT